MYLILSWLVELYVGVLLRPLVASKTFQSELSCTTVVE
jgi:hypothetical protein